MTLIGYPGMSGPRGVVARPSLGGAPLTGLSAIVAARNGGTGLVPGEWFKANDNAVTDIQTARIKAEIDGGFIYDKPDGTFWGGAGGTDTWVSDISTPNPADNLSAGGAGSGGYKVNVTDQDFGPGIWDPWTGVCLRRPDGDEGTMVMDAALWNPMDGVNVSWARAWKPGKLIAIDGTNTPPTDFSTYINPSSVAGLIICEDEDGNERPSLGHAYKHDLVEPNPALDPPSFYLNGMWCNSDTFTEPGAAWKYDVGAVGNPLTKHWAEADPVTRRGYKHPTSNGGFVTRNPVTGFAYRGDGARAVKKINDPYGSPSIGSDISPLMTNGNKNRATGQAVAFTDHNGDSALFGLTSLSHASFEFWTYYDLEGTPSIVEGTFAGDPSALFTYANLLYYAHVMSLVWDWQHSEIILTEGDGRIMAVPVDAAMVSGAVTMTEILSTPTGDVPTGPGACSLTNLPTVNDDLGGRYVGVCIECDIYIGRIS